MAVKEASGLPVEIQFEPPRELGILDEVHGTGGSDAVGIHVETFDPAVLGARRAGQGPHRHRRPTSAPGSARSTLWGSGRVSTYVILGMGEDPELTIEGCRRAVDIGVYPFVVPLRPVAGSLMADSRRRRSAYTDRIYRQVAAYMSRAGHERGRRRGRLRALPGLLGAERGQQPLLQIGPAGPAS